MFQQSLVLGTEHVFIDVAVLDDEAGDPLRCGHRQSQPELAAVILEVDHVSGEPQCVDEALEQVGVGIEVHDADAALARADVLVCVQPPSNERLAKLKPAFRADGKGSVTAGNASGVNDGAVAMTVGTRAVGEKAGIKPLARVASGGEASRLMLILKTTAKEKRAGKAVVFDEIDAGIGGRPSGVDDIVPEIARLHSAVDFAVELQRPVGGDHDVHDRPPQPDLRR